MTELVKPNAALWIREMAIKRFPDWDVDEDLPPGRLIDIERPVLLVYSQDVFRETDVTWRETIGYRVYAGTRADPTEARDAAAIVEAWIWTLARPGPGCPIASVDSSSGPYLVPGEYETAVLYGTADMVVAGVFVPAQTG